MALGRGHHDQRRIEQQDGRRGIPGAKSARTVTGWPALPQANAEVTAVDTGSVARAVTINTRPRLPGCYGVMAMATG
jgi:hypothetical protein